MIRSTKVEFVKKASKIHNNFYEYSKVKYKNNCTKVCIICPIHGEFWQKPGDHLNGYYGKGCGCFKCRTNLIASKLLLGKDKFIKLANKIHNNFYDYSKVEYKGNKIKVCIICPIHGEFLQKPNGHLFGYDCIKCGFEKSGGIGGINKTLFKNFPNLKNKKAFYYKLKFKGNGEIFYKVGITTNFKKRFKKFDRYYKVEIIKLENDTLWNCFKKEQNYLLKVKKYIPKYKFSGWTECFK